jgi:hypothetical protein
LLLKVQLSSQCPDLPAKGSQTWTFYRGLNASIAMFQLCILLFGRTGHAIYSRIWRLLYAQPSIL